MKRQPYNTKRSRAIAAGEPTYLGIVCKQCGTRDRLVQSQTCAKCRADGNTYYSRNTEEQKIKMRAQSRRKWRENRLHYLLSSAKWRAKKAGRDFDLTEDDLEIPEVCPVLGIPMTSPSLDRVDNDRGYVRGNVKVISKRANSLKWNAKVEELEAIVRYMRENQ
jgi:hypothetical protein